MTEPDDRPRAGHPPDVGGPGDATGVYAISVAAELAGVAQQTLRLYETKGLLEPERTAGGTRRYSGSDLARVARILQLTDQGVNLAGIAMILDLQDANSDLRAERARATGSHPEVPPIQP